MEHHHHHHHIIYISYPNVWNINIIRNYIMMDGKHLFISSSSSYIYHIYDDDDDDDDVPYYGMYMI